jgi:hypothetical protein
MSLDWLTDVRGGNTYVAFEDRDVLYIQKCM